MTYYLQDSEDGPIAIPLDIQPDEYTNEEIDPVIRNLENPHEFQERVDIRLIKFDPENLHIRFLDYYNEPKR